MKNYSPLELEIMRHYFHTKSQAERIACLNNLRYNTLPFRKINITTLAARLGKRDLLQLAIHSGYCYMSTIDGQSPLTLAQKNNDYTTMTYLMESFLEFDNKFFYPKDN